MASATLSPTRGTRSAWWSARVARTLAVLASFALLLFAGPGAFAAQERLPLDGFGTDGCDWTGCTVANLDEDPDGAGTDWATAANNNTSHTGHFSFGTPTQPLTSGANLQEFRASVRKDAACGTGTPTARLELWETGGAAPIVAGAEVSVTALNSCTQGTDCQVISLTWSDSDVTSAANVELKVFGTNVSGSPATRCAVDLGAVEWNADVTAVGPSLPTLSAPTAPFATIDTGSATLGATIDDDNGGLVGDYGTTWGTAPAPTGNDTPAAGTSPGAIPPAFPFSSSRTITATPGTLITYRGYADNGAGRGYSPDGSFFLEPNQATGVSISNVTDTGLRVSWTLPVTGAGDGAIVVMKQAAATDADPVDGTAHVASSVFGTGTAEIGATGNYVVFRSTTGTQVDVTGLAPSTLYAVAVYTYAGSAAPSINYQQTTPQTTSATTLAPASTPTLSAPTAPFATIDTGSATLGATIDNDNGDPVGDYGTAWGTAPAPTGNDTPAAGTSPGAIPPAFPFSSSRTISATPGTLITYRGYADNGAGRGYSPDGSFYLEPNQATGVSISNVTDTGLRVSWTLPGAGAGDGTIVVMKQAAATDADPVDGTAHTASSVFGTGAAEIGASGNYVVFRGTTGTQVDVTGLTPSTQYAVAVYTYAGTAAPSINYEQTAPQTTSDTTLAAASVPTLSAPTAPFATIDTGSATLGATIDDDSGDAVGDYGTAWGTAPAPTGNDTPAAGTSPGAIPPAFPFSSSRTITQTPGTLITYRGFADNGQGRGYSPDGSFYLEPNQATGVSISNVTSTGLRVSWTLPGTGAGDGTIVVMKQGVATDADPVDGTAHVASSVFGTGSAEIGATGNYVVFRDATGTQVDVTGLAPTTNYAVAVYTYAGTAAPSINYEQTAPQATFGTTLAGGAVPTVTTPTVSSIGGTSATLGATITSQGGSAVGDYGTVWDTSPAPTANDSPPAGNSPGTIPPSFPFSSVRTLPEASLIYFRGYADNGAGRGYSGEASFYTEAATQAAGVRFPPSRTVETELDVKWSRGSGDGVIVLAREGSPVDADPVDGTEYLFDPIFGNGPEIGTGNYVVYVGAGTQTTIEGIFPDRSYHVAIYETVGSGSGPGGINYLQAGSERGSSGHNGSHAANCVECHFGVGTQHGNFSVPRDAAQQTACESCHNESGPASAKLNFSIHTGPKYTTSVDCGSCHEVHNQYDFNTTDAHSGGVTAPNIQWIRWDTTKYRPTALEPALFQGQTGFYAFDDANAPWNGICQTCHQNTDWHRNDNTLGNPSHDHNMPSDCRNCHDHGGGWLGTGGDCTGCHNQQREITANPGTFRRQITESSAGLGDGEFGTDFTSHHVNDGTGSQIVTKWDCVVCHAEGNAVTGDADGTYHQKDGVQLKDVDTGVAYSDWSGLTPQQRRDFCLSCHDADGATIIITRTDPDPDATTNALDPFNDGVTNSHEPTGLDGKATPHLRGRCSVTTTIPCVTTTDCPGGETCQLSRVLNVEAQFNTSNASHHAVLGAAYGSAAPFGSTVDNMITGVRTDLAWNSTLTCEDCHIGPPDPKGAVPISGHGTPTARYMLRNQNGVEAATAEPSASNLCFRCHTPDDTNSVYPEHLGTTQHSQDFTLFGIYCLQCHGGGTWGGIHGVDAPVVDDDGGGTYNPNVFTYGTGLDLINNWTDWGRAGVSCSSQSAPTALNNCTQHGTKAWERNPGGNDTTVIRTYRVP